MLFKYLTLSPSPSLIELQVLLYSLHCSQKLTLTLTLNEPLFILFSKYRVRISTASLYFQTLFMKPFTFSTRIPRDHYVSTSLPLVLRESANSFSYRVDKHILNCFYITSLRLIRLDTSFKLLVFLPVKF